MLHEISTDHFAPADRLPYWREVFGRAIAKLNIEPMGDEPFHCAATMQALPGLSLMQMTTSASRVSRTRDLIADGGNDFLLSLPRDGTAYISHAGREASIAEGGGVLCHCAEPGMMAFKGRSRFTLVAVPAGVLQPMVRDTDGALVRPISPGSPVLRLLAGYLDTLLQGPALTSPARARSAASHVHDLVALAVGASRDAEHAAAAGGVRAARLAAIRADILANLPQVRLSPKFIARRHGVTERYVHLLFEETGETFGAFVTAARLDRARELLLEPEDLKVSDIAHRVGYGEITTFNRAFRRRFGETPSALRIGQADTRRPAPLSPAAIASLPAMGSNSAN